MGSTILWTRGPDCIKRTKLDEYSSHLPDCRCNMTSCLMPVIMPFLPWWIVSTNCKPKYTLLVFTITHAGNDISATIVKEIKISVTTELRTQNYCMADVGFVCIIYHLLSTCCSLHTAGVDISITSYTLPMSSHIHNDFFVNKYFISSSSVGVT